MVKQENKSKVFLLIIAILLLTNIGMLVFILTKNEPRKQSAREDRKAYIATFLQKEIGFDQQQLTAFDTLSSRHREKMKAMYETLRGNKGEQFKQLVSGNFRDSAINAVAAQSAAAQNTMEIMSFSHLRNIRLLCDPVQRPKFDSLFGKVFNRKGDGRRKSGNKEQGKQ